MARLPDPQVASIEVTWDEGYKEKEKTFYGLIGQAIRKRHREENKNKNSD